MFNIGRQYIVTLLWMICACAPLAHGQNFTSGEQSARKFGVHEIVLRGSSADANPFDVVVSVRFTPPSGAGNARTVWAFYDGENTWRARVYLQEPGAWTWSSTCAMDAALDGKSGDFLCQDSSLRGRLLIHPRNPRQWITEDGRWFLNLNDTSYFLLCAHDGAGSVVSEEAAHDYVQEATRHGITSFRSFVGTGPEGFFGDRGGDLQRWNTLFSDPEKNHPDLGHMQVADRRLRWMLDNYPDAYLQFILFPLGAWRVDDSLWVTFSPQQKERILRHFVARFAAYPQIFWLIINDAHFAPVPLRQNVDTTDGSGGELSFPKRCAMVREVGEFLLKNDPWRHPCSAGPARTTPFHFEREEWATYIHLEDEFDFSARRYEQYHDVGKPVFLGEDRYEQDHPESRDPLDMRYFQRRLFWSWLLSGGMTNYGGRWWTVDPYDQSGQRPVPSPKYKGYVFTKGLTGLDSVKFIRDYFETRHIELSDFQPDHAMVVDLAEGPPVRAPRLMRRGRDEFLVYHPNAQADRRDARVAVDQTAQLRLNLTDAPGTYHVEWFRAEDGQVQAAGTIAGGDWRELTAPWTGADVVLRVSQ